MKKIRDFLTIKRLIIVSLATVVLVWVLVSGKTNIDYINIDASSVTIGGYDTETYSVVSSLWPEYSNTSSVQVTPEEITVNYFDGDDFGYEGNIFNLLEGQTYHFNVDIPETGLYTIRIDQLDVSSNILPNEISIKVNSQFQYDEMKVIELPTFWKFENAVFTKDRYENEILPNSIKMSDWTSTTLHDSTGLNNAPLEFVFESGVNSVSISSVSGEVLFGKITFEPYEEVITYEDYLNNHQGDVIDTLEIIGAEEISFKTNPSITLDSERDPSATSYDTQHLRLNSLDGYSFRSGNDVIGYEVEITESGYYYLGFKYKQDYLMQMPVFREIQIDGEIPFAEVSSYPFSYTDSYQNIILNNGEENYKFYLETGTHYIAMRVVLEPYRNAYENIVGVMDEITDLSLEIKKLTGNTSDQYRTWKLIDYIPDIEDRFERWIDTLKDIDNNLEKYSHQKNPGQLTNLKLAIKQLGELLEDVDDIPNKMVLLADGSSSASQLLGTTVQGFLENGLDIEKIFVGGETELPKPRANFFVATFESIKRFFLSFTSNDYAVSDVDEGVIEVWVNHPRQYIEIMQAMIDNDFTKNTGIKVQLSLMPDENKLILANSSNIGPDVALGVNHWIPYEFAIRNASVDLRQFAGYEETVSNFSPGVMIPYAFEEGIFGLPETQNFYVTYYRSDILDALGVPVPDTWDEVIEILPELQRYGMNYYEPLSFFKGFKPFVATMPFIYQFNGDLYSEDGMSTLINSEETLEGMKLMTDLFTVYNMPKEIPNFYNHFRYGTLPIGISDLSTYLQLTVAAPEIAGKWDIALHPGVENEEGEVERWAASGAQASMILADSNLQQESWDFLSWWMSTDVQTNFSIRLQTTYGIEYLWNTANLNAFANLPLPTKHKNIILEQWDYAIEASRIPGAYMVERELSNAWNKIVFDDANPRITLDEAVKTSNREILYKMEEFGYALNGEVLKPYTVPTIYNIEDWLKERDSND